MIKCHYDPWNSSFVPQDVIHDEISIWTSCHRIASTFVSGNFHSLIELPDIDHCLLLDFDKPHSSCHNFAGLVV